MPTSHPLELEADPLLFDEITNACVEFVKGQLAALPHLHASLLDDAEGLRENFIEPVPERGSEIHTLLDRLAPAVTASLNTAGPGYLGFIPGGGIYASALADYVALAMNRYVGVNKAAPLLAQIERTTLAWLSSLMGYPHTARGIFTSGGSMSNFVAIVTARVARLPEELPLAEARIYVNQETHGSVAKAARLAGFPSRSIRVVDIDANFRTDVSALESAIDRDKKSGAVPFLIVANAGSTNTGAIDPIRAIRDVATREGAWLHVDGAYGGFFMLTKAGMALLEPMAGCDSITLDPHKGLFLPYGTGCLLVRDGNALYQAHRSEAAYLHDVVTEGGAPDFSDLSPELSRDFRGFRLWLPLQLHGIGAFRVQLEEKLRLARTAYDELSRHPEFEFACVPELSVVAFRLKDGDPRRGDARTAELLRRVNARGRVFLSSTLLRGRFTIRVCILSFRTHAERVEEAVTAIIEESRAIEPPLD